MKFRLPKYILAALGVGLACSAQAATLTKANNTNTLDQAGSWVEATAPTTADTLLWNSTVAGANSTALGASISVLGLQVTNPAGDITIANTAGATLTLGAGGIDMSTATQNLSVLSNIAFGGDSSVLVGAGRALTLGANGSSITYAAGTTTTFSGTGTTFFAGNTTNAVNIAGNLTIASGATLVNNMQGGSSTGTGTVTINGNYYTQTSIAGLGSGVVIIGNGASIGGGSGGNGARTIGNNTIISGDFSIANQAGSSSAVTFSGAMDLGGAVRQITSTGSHTISGIVSNGGITKAGAGTLTLSGVNTYAGGTTVNAGELQVLSDTSIGAKSGLGTGAVTVNTGATLRFKTGGTSNAQSYANAINLNGGTLISDDGVVTYGGLISLTGSNTVSVAYANKNAIFANNIIGSGNLTKTGSGDLILNGSGSNIAALTVNQGKVALGSSGSLTLSGAYNSSATSSKGSLDIAAGASLTSASLWSAWGTDMTVNGTLNTGAFTFSGGTSTVTGTGKINVTSLTNRNYGTSNINGARFNIGSGGLTSDTTLNLGATTLGATANWSSTAAMALTNAVTGTTINTLDSVDGTTGRNITLSGVLSGTGSLNKVGAGTLTLSAANTYTGTTTISAGTLQLGNNGATGSLSGSGAIINNSNLTIWRTGTVNQGTHFGSISGTGSLTVDGTGTVTLNAANAYTGITTIRGNDGTNGQVNVSIIGNGGVAGNLGAASSAAANLVFGASGLSTGKLVYTGVGESTDRLFTINGNVIIENNGTGALNFTGTGNLGKTSGISQSLNLGGSNDGSLAANIIKGSGGSNVTVTKYGTGTWTLSGNNTYTGGTTVMAGTLTAGSAGAFGDSTVTVNGGTLNLNGQALTNAITLGASGALAGNGTLSGVLTANNLNTSTNLTLNNASNALTGTTTVNGGTLTAGSAGAFGGSTVTVNGGTLNLNGMAIGNSITIGSAGKLIGASNQSLTNVSFASGAALTGSFGAFNAGTSASKVYNVTGGASFAGLSGQGTFNGGLVTVNGDFKPGNSPGIITSDSGLTVNGTTTFEIAGLGAAGAADGYDQIALTGGVLFLNGTLKIVADPTNSTVFDTLVFGNSFKLVNLTNGATFDAGNSYTFDFSQAQLGSGLQWDTSDFSTTGTISVVNAIPEPSSVGLLGVGLAGMLLRRRRKQA